ncbi:Quinone oxidoreductase-like protein 2 -like protein [Escovopsis weberi]|uniref:Quinone oxidoreductase-like protein 2-like protein n=1 Tax=Escovopsis weberi TaxID=150374 RepID=A0A0M8MR81_ESCWE|nr:Quinone oxidoreductase-like protein 2 -like protein [Escovopsis weberi]
MRAVQVRRYVKSPQDLTVKRLPDPIPRPDEYTIEISAAAANLSDLLQIQGHYQNQPPFPFIAGSEFAGTVVATPQRRRLKTIHLRRRRIIKRDDNDAISNNGNIIINNNTNNISNVNSSSSSSNNDDDDDSRDGDDDDDETESNDSSESGTTRESKTRYVDGRDSFDDEYHEEEVDSGSEYEPFPVGTRVFGAAQGAFATKVCVPAIGLRHIPDGWSFRSAAGLFSAVPTAYAALVARAKVREGDYVLVHAAAGSVGLASIQIAKAYGARVIAMVSPARAAPRPRTPMTPMTPPSGHRAGFSAAPAHPAASSPRGAVTTTVNRKSRAALLFGADHVLSYDEPDWPAKVRALTPRERGVDVVIDPVGLVERSIKCTAWNGRVLVVGFAGGAAERIAAAGVLLKNISLMGVYWGGYYMHERHVVDEVWEGIMRLVADGKIKPMEYCDEEFVGLVQVKEALLKLSKRETWGKVVIRIPKERMKSKL